MTVTRYDFKTDVVGESNYFDSLAKCYFAPEALDCDGGKAVKVELIPEPTNPYDSNAVAIYSDYGKIGYLSKLDAVKYHKIMPSHLTAKVYCRIWTSDPDEGIYGAWLGIDLDNPPQIPTDFDISENVTHIVEQKKKRFFGLF